MRCILLIVDISKTHKVTTECSRNLNSTDKKNLFKEKPFMLISHKSITNHSEWPLNNAKWRTILSVSTEESIHVRRSINGERDKVAESEKINYYSEKLSICISKIEHRD